LELRGRRLVDELAFGGGGWGRLGLGVVSFLRCLRRLRLWVFGFPKPGGRLGCCESCALVGWEDAERGKGATYVISFNGDGGLGVRMPVWVRVSDFRFGGLEGWRVGGLDKMTDDNEDDALAHHSQPHSHNSSSRSKSNGSHSLVNLRDHSTISSAFLSLGYTYSPSYLGPGHLARQLE
jgi:hypothetical protein